MRPWRAGGDGRPVSFPQLPWKETCSGCGLEGDRVDYTQVTFVSDGGDTEDDGYLCPTCAGHLT